MMEGYGVNNKYVDDLKRVLNDKYPSLKYELYFFDVPDKPGYINEMRKVYSLFVNNNDEFIKYMDNENFL
jgi:hypothetical protein